MKKERLDAILVQKGFFETKSKAQAAIMAGDVIVNNEKIFKAGEKLPLDENLMIEVKTQKYVSRGGLKLEKALEEFNINVKNKICLDAGASTGGFTDCLLQNGATKIYAVDVGYGQLDWKLRNNDRVKVIEKTNIKNCSFNDIYSENDEIAELSVADLSFISLTKVLGNIKNLMKPENIELITLIKPQFEAGKENIGKNGVVTDKNIHEDVIRKVKEHAENIDLFLNTLTFSPIKGPAGNIEYLAYFSDNKRDDVDIEKVVREAFNELK